MSTSNTGGPAAAKRAQQLVIDLAKQCCIALNSSEQKKLESMVQQDLGVKEMPDDPDELWQALKTSVHRKAISKAELGSFTAALRFCEYLQSSKDVFEDLVPTLAAKLKMKITKRFSLRMLAVRAVINFGNDRRAWSTNAQAIEWLQTQTVPVTAAELMSWRQKHGGGPASWSKALQQQRKQAAADSGAKVSNQTSAAKRLAVIRKKAKEGGGAVMLIKKEKGKLYSLKSYTMLKINKNALWPKLKAAISKAKTSK